MNKQEYLLGLHRIDKYGKLIGLSGLLFLLGIPLAAVTPHPWNVVALLVPYFISISIMASDPLRLFVNYNAMHDYKEKCLEAYNGDKTVYLQWNQRRYKNLPFYGSIYAREKAASRRVVLNAVEAYRE